MWTGEIVDEMRKAREEYAARFGHDLQLFYEDLKRQEQQGKCRIVSLSSREPDSIPQAKAS